MLTVTSNTNKDKCLFICISISFFSEIISQLGLSPDLCNIQVLVDMPLLKKKRSAIAPGYPKVPK